MSLGALYLPAQRLNWRVESLKPTYEHVCCPRSCTDCDSRYEDSEVEGDEDEEEEDAEEEEDGDAEAEDGAAEEEKAGSFYYQPQALGTLLFPR